MPLTAVRALCRIYTGADYREYYIASRLSRSGIQNIVLVENLDLDMFRYRCRLITNVDTEKLFLDSLPTLKEFKVAFEATADGKVPGR